MNKRRAQIKEVADFYDFESQSRQCIEECAELIQALNKVWRALKNRDIGADSDGRPVVKERGRKALRSAFEEIADVQIMLWQMERKLKCRDDVEEAIDAKIERQVDRVDRLETEIGVVTTIKSRVAIEMFEYGVDE